MLSKTICQTCNIKLIITVRNKSNTKVYELEGSQVCKTYKIVYLQSNSSSLLKHKSNYCNLYKAMLIDAEQTSTHPPNVKSSLTTRSADERDCHNKI